MPRVLFIVPTLASSRKAADAADFQAGRFRQTSHVSSCNPKIQYIPSNPITLLFWKTTIQDFTFVLIRITCLACRCINSGCFTEHVKRSSNRYVLPVSMIASVHLLNMDVVLTVRDFPIIHCLNLLSNVSIRKLQCKIVLLRQMQTVASIFLCAGYLQERAV